MMDQDDQEPKPYRERGGTVRTDNGSVTLFTVFDPEYGFLGYNAVGHRFTSRTQTAKVDEWFSSTEAMSRRYKAAVASTPESRAAEGVSKAQPKYCSTSGCLNKPYRKGAMCRVCRGASSDETATA